MGAIEAAAEAGVAALGVPLGPVARALDGSGEM
jgi:hypothetical protein